MFLQKCISKKILKCCFFYCSNNTWCWKSYL